MATEFKLNYTATQVNEKLGQIENKANKDWVEEQIEALDFINEEQAAEITQVAIDNIEIGGRNLLLNSGEEVTLSAGSTNLIQTYTPATPLIAGEKYTISVCVTPPSDTIRLQTSNGQGQQWFQSMYVTGAARQIVKVTITMAYASGYTPEDDPINANIRLYRYATDGGAVAGDTIVHWIKIEKGNKPTDWTPAPEDFEEDITSINNKITPMEEKLAGLNNSNIINGTAAGSLRTINSLTESATYSLGNYAFAEGASTRASGQSSHAEGNATEASGAYAHAEGYNTKATSTAAHAEGGTTTASGYYSHAEGGSTVASGSYSHVEGYQSQATGVYSHASGNNSKAEGQSSLAVGTYSVVKGYYSNAIGYYLLSNEGYETVIGKYNLGTNVATNTITTTNTTYGFNTSATYTCSTTAPTVSLANGTITWTNTSTKRAYQFSTNNYVKLSDTSYCRITGSSTTSGSQISFPIERKTLQLATTKLSPYAFIVGNGTATSLRSNAHTLDWDGNAWYSGEVYVGGTNKDSGTKLAHQPKIKETNRAPENLLAGLESPIGMGTCNPDDVIEIRPDYSKDTSAEYREAVRNAQFVATSSVYQTNDDGTQEVIFNVIPDGEVDSSITAYHFLIINHGPGGAW